MLTVMLGLRLAMTALFAAILFWWSRDPAEGSLSDRLRLAAWALVALATVFGWGPVRISSLLGHPFPAPTENMLRVAAMILMIAAAMLWAAARGLRLGGSRASVVRGIGVNISVVGLCMALAALLR